MTDNAKKMRASDAQYTKVNTMVKIALLAAMAGVLMVIFKFPLPFAPPYMTVDFGDVPTLIAGFALGPVSGVITVILKNLINLMLNGSTTGGVGELSNIIVGSTFVVLSSVIYQRDKTRKNAALGLFVGLLGMTALATLSNYFIIFPLYKVPVESFGWLASFVVPFNLVKGALNGLLTLAIYKYISNIFKKF